MVGQGTHRLHKSDDSGHRSDTGKHGAAALPSEQRLTASTAHATALSKRAVSSTLLPSGDSQAIKSTFIQGKSYCADLAEARM